MMNHINFGVWAAWQRYWTFVVLARAGINYLPRSRSRHSEPRRKPLTIAILSFDRPGYLKKVLASLIPQLRGDDEILLFQDGGWDRFAQQSLRRDARIEACLAAFDRFFTPDRRKRLRVSKFVSRDNLGIAGNYRRAESHVFETLGRESVLLLEDDLVLGPHYLFLISKLLEVAEREPKLGYVAAYGDLWASRKQQRARVSELVQMHENWGAALTRRSWLAQKPFRERYWDLVKDSPYHARDNQAIRDLYREFGYVCEYTSQDASRWVACCVAGLARVMTAACQARYIGISGMHFTPELYARFGFANSKIFLGRPDVPMPGPGQIAAWIEQNRQSFREGYVHAYQKLVAAG